MHEHQLFMMEKMNRKHKSHVHAFPIFFYNLNRFTLQDVYPFYCSLNGFWWVLVEAFNTNTDPH